MCSFDSSHKSPPTLRLVLGFKSLTLGRRLAHWADARCERRIAHDLAGGTIEQIAILTRLAFARLFARRVRHRPIILDDALIFLNNDRII